MPSLTPQENPYEVGVLSKALDIFDHLRNAPRGSSLTELATALKYSKPTVFRILRTLEHRGYVERSNGFSYQLSGKLGFGRHQNDLMTQLMGAAPEVMRSLVQKTAETVNLGILDAGEIVVVHAIESPQTIRMSSKTGNRRHVHSTALGKALMAWREPAEINRVITMKGLSRFTRRTIGSVAAFNRELARVRKQGYAEDNEENEPGGRCVAAPICNAAREIVAAISVSGPRTRMTDRKVKLAAKHVIEAAEGLSDLLGGKQFAE